MSKKFEKLIGLYLQQKATAKENDEFFEMLSTGIYDEVVMNNMDHDISNDMGLLNEVSSYGLAVNDVGNKLLMKLSITVMVLILIVASIIGLLSPITSNEKFASRYIKENSFEVTNSGNTKKQIRLPDGSSVVLKPKASLFFSKEKFLNNRSVLLKGEAYFDVSKNRLRPFRVYHESIVTQVLGTSFEIKKNKAGNVEVVVLTGKVKIFRNQYVQIGKKPLPNVLVMANQKVTYYEDEDRFIKGLLDAPIIVDQHGSSGVNQQLKYSNLFRFDNTPLHKIFEIFQANYNIEFVVAQNHVNNCVFTGDLRKADLFDQLRIICKATNLAFSINETNILISGKGCK